MVAKCNRPPRWGLFRGAPTERGGGTPGADGEVAVHAKRTLKCVHSADGSSAMLDVVFVIVTVAFFAVSILYARACDHL
ncbi:MAG TPA: hypothetical protein VGL19_04585 [Polyangiaceae bacterium]|jgi:hypothetical protein